MTDVDVLVVGGGIAGLSCAWTLRSAGRDVLLLEAAERPGGHVQTETADDFMIEHGPHTFLPSADALFELTAGAGLAESVVASRDAARARFIVRHGAMHQVFTGPMSLLRSRLLSARGKVDLLTECLRTGRRGQPGESAETFFARRLGPEAGRVMAGAFISGVYAGDPAALEAESAFPLFWGFEREHGSLIRGAFGYYRARARQHRANGEPERPRGLCALRRGLGQLTGTLAARLGSRCLTGTRVGALHHDGRHWIAEPAGDVVRARRVVLATPPPEAGRLLQGVDLDLASLVGAIPMAPVAVVHLGYRRRAAEVPDAFGVLAPRGEGIRTLGVLFPSRLFAGRAPDGGDLFSAYVGGTTDPGALALDDRDLVGLVSGDLARLTGLAHAPDMTRVMRHHAAIPQFVAGHARRRKAIEHRRRRLPALHLAGNWIHGVGMKDAVRSGLETACVLLDAPTHGGQP